MGKIYTKTGDKGSTSLLGGTRVEKSHRALELYGTVDELNCHIGMMSCFLREAHLNEDLLLVKRIQDNLFVMGSALACEKENREKFGPFLLEEGMIQDLEKSMDRMEEKMPQLKSFILPGGSKGAASLHICRAVTRRLERSLAEASEELELDQDFLIFINRLSDYFFDLARFYNQTLKVEDVIWQMN